MISVSRPQPDESNTYFRQYIDLVEGDNILQALKDQMKVTIEFLSSIDHNKSNYAYADGKWTLNEVLIHIFDTERIFSYRALRIGRNDTTSLAGFEQDEYIPYTNVEARNLQSMIAEYLSIRNATISLLQNMNDSMINRVGEASDNKLSCRAAFFIIAGHELHHLKVIKELYL